MTKENDLRKRILTAFNVETITEVANLLGVKKMTFTNYVNGERAIPATLLAEMETRTGRPAQWFLTGEENEGDIGHTIAYKLNLLGKFGEPHEIQLGKGLAEAIDKQLDEMLQKTANVK